MSADTTQFDSKGRTKKIQYHDGTFEEYAYNARGLSKIIDRNGNVTDLLRNPQGRVTHITREGITYVRDYDPQGNLLDEIRIGRDDTEMFLNSYTYNVAGRLETHTDAEKRVTRFEEQIDEFGTYTRKTVFPDSTVEILVTDKDGNHIEDSENPNKRTEYGSILDPDLGYDVLYYQIYDGEKWTRIFTNYDGYVYKKEYSTGGQSRAYFNDLGYVEKTISVDGEITLYKYDDLGFLTTTAQDVNKNGQIDYSGPDRIVRKVVDYTTGRDTQLARTRIWVWGVKTTVLNQHL